MVLSKYHQNNSTFLHCLSEQCCCLALQAEFTLGLGLVLRSDACWGCLNELVKNESVSSRESWVVNFSILWMSFLSLGTVWCLQRGSHGSIAYKGKITFPCFLFLFYLTNKTQTVNLMIGSYWPGTWWCSKGKLGLAVILYLCKEYFCIFFLLRLSPAAYYAQRMIQYLSRRDSIRQRSMRYQQNRLRSSSSSASTSENSSPSVEGNDLEFEDFE